MQARCAVCGSDLKGAVRACGRCESKYHPDCWAYNDGCAIYGCRRVAARTVKPAAMPAWQGPAFGAMLGASVIGGWIGQLERNRWDWEPMVFLLCAIILGGFSGRWLRHRHDARRIAIAGLLGPGLAYCAILLPLAPFYPQVMVYAPLVVLCGMIVSPLALPCAIVAARFNDPELANPRRQRLWLAVALVMCLVALAVQMQKPV
jgi:hypothetical protein